MSHNPGVPERSTIYGVGLGSGDPRLVTIKALDILRSSRNIFLPCSGNRDGGRAHSILASLDPGLIKKAYRLEIPMGHGGAAKWERAAQEMLNHLIPGFTYAYATLGDPMLYGSFIHVISALRRKEAGIRIEAVSGVNSFSAAAAQTLFPLGVHSERIAILCGPLAGEELERYMTLFDTLVLMKIQGCLLEIGDFLRKHSNEIDWICVENCTAENQFVGADLADFMGRKWGYFTVLLIRRRY